MKKIFILINILISIILFVSCSNINNSTLSKIKLPNISEIYNESVSTIIQEELTDALTYLASDELEGRASGEKGNEMAAEFIANEFESYGLIPGMGDSYYQPFDFDSRGQTITTSNVIGYIPGNHPELKDEVIVIGAHYDHIGYNPKIQSGDNICNGANDNASGTTGLLGIAKALSSVKDKINRTIVFIAFSGEELGTFGSKHYVENPIFPLDDTVLMFNFEMIGDLSEVNPIVRARSIRYENLRNIVVDIADDYSFNIDLCPGSSGNSDHMNFRYEGIPTIALYTFDSECVYHTPDDEVKYINFEGLTEITKYALELILTFDAMDEIPVDEEY